MNRDAISAVSSLVLAAAMLAAVQAAPLRVELNGANGRNDVTTRGWADWRIPLAQAEATSASGTFGEVRLTVRAVGDGARLASDWWKRGLDFGATLTSDGAGVVSSAGPATLDLVIAGLPAGRHTLASWHASWADGPATPFDVAVDGRDVGQRITPPSRVEHDAAAAVVFVEFEARAGQPVIVRYAPVAGGGGAMPIVLNALVIDGVDPRPQARRPTPADGDEHAAEAPLLRWLPPPAATAFQVYLGTDPTAVEAAMVGSPEHLGRTEAAAIRATRATRAARRAAQQPNLDWYWRVDAIDREGGVTAGPVWRFRVGVPAFATAEGHGRLAAGGRGGRVIAVTTLEDSGPGSLREAIDTAGPRTIVFRVGGTIRLASKLIVRHPCVTIAGQTAPGDGICVRGFTFGCLGAHDVVIRHVRIRVGDESGETQDGTGLASCDHSIIDHCSVSWSIDEGVSSRGARNITVQRCLVSEALNIANHRKYQPGKGHSFAGSISGDVGSFHHNLLAHCAGRNWSLAGGLSRGGRFAGRLDVRNNVVYNWESRTTDGGVKALTFVGNLYIPGPATRVFHLVKPDTGSPTDPQQYFIAGNRMLGRPAYDADNWANGGVVVAADAIPQIRLEAPFCDSLITEQSADDAYASVMADVGANRPALDKHDRRILREVATRTAAAKGSRGGLPGIIDTQADVGGWPDLKSGPAPADGDADGMADAWERSQGLDPANATDAHRFAGNSDWTNLERYLDELAGAPAAAP
jgi:hypothetical protein